ncbi:Clp protease N-terminal domain-containing protein [Micromonospora sp. DSM 115977]|uniref:Clp protease N-terminal domain-containing protein n=1 Tax=Micromonospora reichwaldensis TaxID=3075516 RepID=A0ABU2X431_9ACTN|nr:Clp protease N-terminal domain-containing protein [Micromonospora sp. DSM 115977]MDT0532174.1 Clp protease N-terminal domain-containing protein [Micromonospora sp. DSM 115977]
MADQEPLDDAFARYSDRARTAVAAAQEQAHVDASEHVDTEHILLGLVAAGDGVAAAVLKIIGTSLETVRQHMEPAERTDPTSTDVLSLTADAQSALDRALTEATKCGDGYVGTQHLLLGLLSAGDSTAVAVLNNLGVTYARAFDGYLSLLSPFTGGAPSPRQEPPGGMRQAPPRIGLPPELGQYNQRIAEAQQQKEAAVDAQDYNAAATARTIEKAVLAERNAMIRRWAADIDAVVLVDEIDRLYHEVDRLEARLDSQDT